MLVHITNHIQVYLYLFLSVYICTYMHALCILVYFLYKQFQLIMYIYNIYIVYNSIDLFIHF